MTGPQRQLVRSRQRRPFRMVHYRASGKFLALLTAEAARREIPVETIARQWLEERALDAGTIRTRKTVEGEDVEEVVLYSHTRQERTAAFLKRRYPIPATVDELAKAIRAGENGGAPRSPG